MSERIGFIDRDGLAVDMSQIIGSISDSESSGDGSLIAILKYIRTLLLNPLVVTSPTLLAQLVEIVALLSGTLTTTISGLPLQPTTFVPLAALDVSAEATIWDPAVGKKFRLMGGLISVTDAAGNVVLKDGNGGATIFNVPNAVVGTALAFSLGDGILSAAANNNLRALGAALQIMNGTIWGIEV